MNPFVDFVTHATLLGKLSLWYVSPPRRRSAALSGELLLIAVDCAILRDIVVVSSHVHVTPTLLLLWYTPSLLVFVAVILLHLLSILFLGTPALSVAATECLAVYNNNYFNLRVRLPARNHLISSGDDKNEFRNRRWIIMTRDKVEVGGVSLFSSRVTTTSRKIFRQLVNQFSGE